MKLISFQDIRSLGISPQECYAWTERMIKEKKKALLPPKISMKPADGVFCNVMPSILEHPLYGATGGVKVVTRYPGRVPSLESQILLMDAETGEFLALMDGTWITAMRTGAVAAHSVLLFAKTDFQVLGMMGLGNTARAALMILADRLPEREFHVKLLRYKGQELSFRERFQEYPNLHFQFVDSPQSLVKGSDVVISGVTYLSEDLCPDDCYDEGVLVVPIHTRGFTNCDLFFDRIFADDLGHVRHFKNFDRFRSFAEVCDVVNREAPGRESDRERILAYNIGISVHDMNYAIQIYHLWKQDAEAFKALPDIDLAGPTEKFWV